MCRYPHPHHCLPACLQHPSGECGLGKKIGLRAIANTEHAPSISGAPFIWYITNQKIIPEVIDGVIVLKGVEANVLDWEGHLDVSDERLAKLDWVIASAMWTA